MSSKTVSKQVSAEVPFELEVAPTPEGLEIEPRKLKGGWQKGISFISAAFALFQLYTAYTGSFPDYIQRSIHVCFALVIAFAIFPASKKSPHRDRVLWIDIVLMALATVTCLWVTFNYVRIVEKIGEYVWVDILFGVIIIVVIWEASRRILGIALPLLGLLTILYAYLGPYIPGIFAHRGFDFTSIVEALYLNPIGIWGVTTGISASLIAGFLIFGVVLSYSGGGDTFVDLAKLIAGRAIGGPAKVSVFSSAFFGTISGSAAANVIVDGVFNIPLMKKLGYKTNFAAAVEATTSTGGQIVPPVMGSGAFIMSELISVSYILIAAAAAIPAVLYYAGCWFFIHFEAQRLNLRRIPPQLIPNTRKILPNLPPLVIPVGALLYFLLSGTSPALASFYAVITSFALLGAKYRSKEKLKKLLPDIFKILDESGKAVVLVATLCVCAQIVIGMFSSTGLGIRISEIIMVLARGKLFLTLFFTMIVCLVLGMGIPTTAAYLLAASVCGPVLYKLGLTPLAAHLFIFYFAIISAITPPVCAAVYAASAIAHSNWWKTGWIAVRMGISGFIVPFMFAYAPGIILKASVPTIVQNSITAFIGVMFLAGGVSGFFKRKNTLIDGALLLAAAVLLIDPSTLTDTLGLCLGALVFIKQQFFSGPKAGGTSKNNPRLLANEGPTS